MTYGFCGYHEIKCDYKGNCIDCPHTLNQRWIPVSEKLPKEEEIVLITIDSSYYIRPCVDMGFYKVETKKWYWFSTEDINPSIKVIAWMPLPEPYKESEADDE